MWKTIRNTHKTGLCLRTVGKRKASNEGSQELAFFFRIDLQCCGVGRCFEDADESDACSDDEYGNGNVHHGDQNKIIKGLQGILL